MAVGPADGGEDARYADSVILPGLVNAHTHLEYTAMAGFGDGMPFSPWIADHIRRKDTQEEADLLAQSRAGAAACLAGGVTTVADCCYAGTVAQAAGEAGLRAIVYLEGFSVWEGLEARIEAALDALPTSALVHAGVSPHAPFTVTHDDYAMLVALARRRGLPVATHLLESDRETEHLDAFAGVLGPDTVAVHGVLLNEADIALLAELDVPVAHCPRSNALLGCGIAPLSELLAAGVRVGLGTDSPSSALDFDMWAEMRAAIMLARARTHRADALAAETALELATVRAADAIGLGGEVGSLTPGQGRRPDRARPVRIGVSALGRPGHRDGLRRLPRPGRTDGRCGRDTLQARRMGEARCLRRARKDDPGPARLTPCCSNASAAPRSRSSSSWPSCSGWGSSRWASARA